GQSTAFTPRGSPVRARPGPLTCRCAVVVAPTHRGARLCPKCCSTPRYRRDCRGPLTPARDGGPPDGPRCAMSDKIDVKKDLDAYRARHGHFRLVEVPVMRYLMVDGHGDPNTSQAFAGALAALYPVAYRLKFLSKRE